MTEKPQEMDVESGDSPGPTNIPHFKALLDQGFVTPEVAKAHYDGSGTVEDPYVVEWIENDSRNPQLFNPYYKWQIALAQALTTLAVAFCSSAYAGGMPEIMLKWQVSQEVATLGLSLFVMGFAVGPLIWAPISELYGRQVVFIIAFGAFTAFNAATAGAQNIETVIVLRFFSGAFGASALTNAGAVIADIFPPKERGVAMGFFSAAPFMGPVLGPIVGGFVGQGPGFRWIEGIMAILSGVMWVWGSLMIPETYAPVLLRRRAQRLAAMNPEKVYRSKVDIDHGAVSAGEAFGAAIGRPWILLFMEPIVLILSLYMSIIYGTLYMLFGAYPIVFQGERGWSQGIAGLAFIGVMIGMFGAITYSMVIDKKAYLKAVKNSPSGFAPPEARLPASMVGAVTLPIGLFWFAWTNDSSVHWLSPVAAGVPFGFSMVLVFLSVMNYLIDAYTIFAASVLAGSSILRSCFGAAFPLFTRQMYDGLGIHWASSIPAFLGLACLPFPFLFYKYGAAIRLRCTYAAQADRFMQSIRTRAAPAKEKTSDVDGAAEAAEDEDKEKREREEAAESSGRESPAEERPHFEPVRSGRSTESRREEELEYEPDPFDIDRVHTRESFASHHSHHHHHHHHHNDKK